ncbi:MAG: protein kinase [Candidatus Aminicenantes bacterium]|jgi:serine/threonine protein kinase
MQQCSQCQRFLSDEVNTCTYCGSSAITAASIIMDQDEEFTNYKITAHEIIANEKSYRVIAAVGQGGYGVVLKAEDSQGKCYAVKVPLEFNESFTNSQGNKKSLLNISHKYISHEVEMLNKITSQALLEVIYAGSVTCRGTGEEHQFPAVLMELAQGTLKDIMDSEMAHCLQVPYEEKVNIIRQLTENLEKLHKKIVVHRDISPHNVFIVDREKEINYVLGDFGSSKPANVYDIDNSTTRLAFHDRYLDPAVFMVDRFRYDSRIDIYQLGVMITEILMGEYWQTDDEESVVSGIQGIDFEKDFLMTFAVNDIHPSIIEKIRKATTRKINKRYRSAADFKKEIHEALQRVEKEGKKIKPKEEIKKNISIAYQRILQAPAQQEGAMGTGKENDSVSMQAIDYKGQRKIDIGTADQVRVNFNGLQLKKAKIMGASFLKCQQDRHSILLQVDTEDIKKRIEPIMNPGIITRFIHFLGSLFLHSRAQCPGPVRIEFDCQAILYVEFHHAKSNV